MWIGVAILVLLAIGWVSQTLHITFGATIVLGIGLFIAVLIGERIVRAIIEHERMRPERERLAQERQRQKQLGRQQREDAARLTAALEAIRVEDDGITNVAQQIARELGG